jgi:hypothetical protein
MYTLDTLPMTTLIVAVASTSVGQGNIYTARQMMLAWLMTPGIYQSDRESIMGCQNPGMMVDSSVLCNGLESYYLYYNPFHSFLQSCRFLTSHLPVPCSSPFISNLSREYQEILRMKQLCTAMTAPCKNFWHRQSPLRVAEEARCSWCNIQRQKRDEPHHN